MQLWVWVSITCLIDCRDFLQLFLLSLVSSSNLKWSSWPAWFGLQYCFTGTQVFYRLFINMLCANDINVLLLLNHTIHRRRPGFKLTLNIQIEPGSWLWHDPWPAWHTGRSVTYCICNDWTSMSAALKNPLYNGLNGTTWRKDWKGS